ncbi:replication factor C subunit 4 isoform X2 [Hyposmocoma kahamanoa]|uniref:replication factor C subunit 4 isoform X2 n=1 Tax=Hyposmocoma kahamanoa TaxID=1477025 RepID=UPI000E6D7BEC|nr:replication factor C subunit 4 isoform X2 [Hyposmocoma kahamanoa]
MAVGRADKPSTSGAKPAAKKKPPAPWVEKYRPKTIDDIVDQGEVVQVLRECLSGGDLPHLLFYGPPGTGKTSAILAAARQLFGDLQRDRVLELNASDERGIQVIRDKVKTFSQMTVSSTKPDGRPCPPYKLVILDEADSMTTAAQAALRRTMERETRTTRFCLICNYVSRIIPPITSRCSKFRFKPLARENVIKRLQEICEAECVEVGNGEVFQQAVDTCQGDLRRALTALQCCQRLLGKITAEGLIEVTGLVPEQLVNEYLSVKNYSELEQFVEKFLMEAYSAAQLLEQLSATVINAGHLTNKQKCVISDKIAICSHRLLDGGAEYMQLTDLGCTIIVANNDP